MFMKRYFFKPNSLSKFLVAVALIALTGTIKAQNIQFHYDFGRHMYNDISERYSTLITIEFFKPDRWGNTYCFTDITNYGDGCAGAYWELFREFDVTKNKQWAVHVEYDGGASSIKNTADATRYQHAALAGMAWNWASKDFTKTFSVRAMYKQYFNGMYRKGFAGAQLTFVWGINFANQLLTFSGFWDTWYDPDVNGKLIILAQPQFWVNFNALRGMKNINLSVGTEVEFSNNFIFNKYGNNNQCFCIPTIAAKWTF